MNWEYAIPKVEAGEASKVTELVMDDEAFTGFYQRSAPSVWAYLARVVGDPALADDLMQESYLRFLCKATAVDGEVACRRYLFQIATNLMRDHWRRPKQSAIEDVPERFVAVDPGHRSIEKMDASAALEPAMAQMKPRERQLLWLAHAEDYSHKEIADIMGLGAASVRLLLFRARRKMARLLRETSKHGGRMQ